MVPQKFYKWLKVFEKVKSERMLIRKLWDHAINLKENFVPKKGRIYLILRQKKRESMRICRRTAQKRVH